MSAEAFFLGRAGADRKLKELSATLARVAEHAGKSLREGEVSRVKLDERLAECRRENSIHLDQHFQLVLDALSAVEAMGQGLRIGLDGLHELRADVERLRHENSPSGYGADHASAPAATGGAGTPTVGDTIGDTADETEEALPSAPGPRGGGTAGTTAVPPTNLAEPFDRSAPHDQVAIVLADDGMGRALVVEGVSLTVVSGSLSVEFGDMGTKPPLHKVTATFLTSDVKTVGGLPGPDETVAAERDYDVRPDRTRSGLTP